MLLQGQTSEFSLPELFKLLKDSQQTGRLSLKSLSTTGLEGDPHYFWFEQGNLVAASQRLDGLGLLTLLRQRSLLQSSTLPQLLRQCPPKLALGSFLQQKAVLTTKQLQSFFAHQVLRNTCRMIQVSNVRFAFYPGYPFPYLEMTGIKIHATDITLPSLRMIKDWGTLMDKLPGLDSGLKPGQGNVPLYRLNSDERRVLQLASSGNSLGDIAIQMRASKLAVQKIGFRLIFVGMAVELPMVYVAKAKVRSHRPAPSKVSDAFLSKLSSYLQKTADSIPPHKPVPIPTSSASVARRSPAKASRPLALKAAK